MNSVEYSQWLASLASGDCVGVREGPGHFTTSTVRELSYFSVVLIDGRLFSRRTGKLRGHSNGAGRERARLVAIDDWWLLHRQTRNRAECLSARVRSVASASVLDKIEAILTAAAGGEGE